MFPFIKALLVFSTLGLVTGCASNVQFQESAPRHVAGTVEYTVSSEIRSPEKIFAQAKSIDTNAPTYYFQNFGGGGVGVGLLLGPIGVAANVAMITSKTNEEALALKNKLAINPVELANKALTKKTKLKQSLERAGFKIFPYILVVKGEHDLLHITTTLDAVSGPWKGRYSYHIKQVYPLDSMKNGLNANEHEQLFINIQHGFSEAANLFEKDITGSLTPVRNITFYSESISPRFKFPVSAKLVAEENDEVIVLGPGGADQLNLILASGYHKLSKSQAQIGNR